MKVFVFLFAVVSVCLAAPRTFADEPGCKAPNGGGLQPVLEEFVKLLPVEDIAVLFLTALSDDKEVQDVMEYLQSDKFKSIVVAIQSTPEFSELIKFACENVYLDVAYYFNILGGFLGLPPVPHPSVRHMRDAANYRSGLLGLLEDILDILPVAELKKMFDEKMATDEYLQLAMKVIASDKFQNIVNTLDNLDEYKNMLQEMRDLGVDVDAVIVAVRKFFQWG